MEYIIATCVSFILILGIFFTVLAAITFRILWLFHQTYCTSKCCLVGKTAVVTGGSAGIGYQIVLGLASRGCRVIIADCNVNESIKNQIIKETHNPNIILKYVNLASFKSVRKFAEDLRKSENKLDILINNAGVGRGKEILTEDGLNLTLQVNYYSTFLLTHLLIDLMMASSGSRIIFTSSDMSQLRFMLALGQQKLGIDSNDVFSTYVNSKFWIILASDSFAEKLKTYGITCNSYHPFIAKTAIFKKSFEGLLWYERLLAMHTFIGSLIAGKSAEEAAQTGIYLACANEVKNISGEYFGNFRPTMKPLGSDDAQLRKTIWEKSEEVVGLTSEEKLA